MGIVGAEVVPVKVSHSNNHDGSKTKCEARLASDQIYSKTHRTSALLLFFFSFFFSFLGLASAPATPVAAWGMSVILASGEMLFQGRQLIKVSDKCWGGETCDSLFCLEVKSCTL